MPFPILAMMLCVFGVGTAEYVVTGVLPEIANDFNVSIPTAGLLVTVYAVTVMIGGPLLTVLTVKVPRRMLMVSLMALFIVGNLLAALATSFSVLVAARVVSALAHATLFAMCIIVACSLVSADRQGRAIANVALGLNLATVLGVPLGTFVGHAINWRATFICLAVFSAVATALLMVAVKSVPSTSTSSIRSELRVFGNSGVLTAILITALGQSGVFIVFTYIAPLLTHVTKFDLASVTVLLLVFGVGSIVGNYVGGRLTDRAPMTSLVGLLAALTIGLVVLWATISSKPVTVIMLFVFGATAFAIIPGLATRLLTAASDAPNLAATVNIAGFQVANALGSWVGGLIIASRLGLPSLPLFGAAAAAMSLVVALVVWHWERHTVAPDTTISEVDGRDLVTG